MNIIKKYSNRFNLENPSLEDFLKVTADIDLIIFLSLFDDSQDKPDCFSELNNDDLLQLNRKIIKNEIECNKKSCLHYYFYEYHNPLNWVINAFAFDMHGIGEVADIERLELYLQPNLSTRSWYTYNELWRTYVTFLTKELKIPDENIKIFNDVLKKHTRKIKKINLKNIKI